MTQGPPALASPAAVSLAAAVPDRDGSGAHTADDVDDPDQASSLLATVYSPNRLSVLGPRAAFRMRWRRDALGPMLLSTLSFDTEVELRQQAPQSSYLVSTQLSGRAEIDAGDARGGGGAGLVVVDSATRGVVKRFSADSQRLHVRLPREEVSATCAELLGQPLPRPPEFDPLMPAGGPAQQRWLALTALLLDRADAPAGSPLLSRLHRQLTELAILTLLTEHRHSYSDRLRVPVPAPAPRHVRRAEAFMRAHAADAPTLADVARAAGVGVRTLSAGFQAQHGSSPMRWLRELRLQGARADLRRGDGSVADIALRWGFGHFGRFAADYARRFGEAPSRTLRQG